MAVFPDPSPQPMNTTNTTESASAVTGTDPGPTSSAIVEADVASHKQPAPSSLVVRSLSYRSSSAAPHLTSWKEWAEDKGTFKGSRHRRRWENDRLSGVPNVQPPLPIDYAVRPSYPIRNNVPYHLATLWDQRNTQSLCLRVEDTEAKSLKAKKRRDRQLGRASGIGRGEVPRELRDAIKRSEAVWWWVRGLEETVRAFMARQAEDGWEHVEDDVSVSEGMLSGDEDEVVLVAPRYECGGEGKLVLSDASLNGQMGSYKRWLVHAIADYYGLNSYSATVGSGSNARRVVHVEGAAKAPSSPVRRSSINSFDACLPRPVWEVCQGKW